MASPVKATIDKYWDTLDNDMKIMVALSALKCDSTKLATAFSWACQIMALRELEHARTPEEQTMQESLIKQTMEYYHNPKEKKS